MTMDFGEMIGLVANVGAIAGIVFLGWSLGRIINFTPLRPDIAYGSIDLISRIRLWLHTRWTQFKNSPVAKK
jgi:hypothetical protein